MSKFSIKSIDKIAQVCYTEIKLENKTNILTNNKIKTKINKNKKGNNMATNTYQIPKLEYYDKEADYVPPTEVSKEAIEKIKSRNIKIGKIALFGNL